MSTRAPDALRLSSFVPVVLLLAACGGPAGAPTAGSTDPAAVEVEVSSTDTTCDLDTTELAAGTHQFTVTNAGTTVTEFYVYVYAEGDRVVGEVENIAPGVARSVLVELSAGSYEAACKPGMAGDGIRTALIVTD